MSETGTVIYEGLPGMYWCNLCQRYVSNDVPRECPHNPGVGKLASLREQLAEARARITALEKVAWLYYAQHQGYGDPSRRDCTCTVCVLALSALQPAEPYPGSPFAFAKGERIAALEAENAMLRDSRSWERDGDPNHDIAYVGPDLSAPPADPRRSEAISRMHTAGTDDEWTEAEADLKTLDEIYCEGLDAQEPPCQ